MTGSLIIRLINVAQPEEASSHYLMHLSCTRNDSFSIEKGRVRLTTRVLTRTPPDYIHSLHHPRSEQHEEDHRILATWQNIRLLSSSHENAKKKKVKENLKHGDGGLKATWRVKIQKMYILISDMASSLSSASRAEN
ncbi:hypothetical protein EYC80_004907 [Monilinia laxa]|uniref:Uncharacterized protein n=1 Tax=Monilinia laxa TaxID=61186 RepID=A0A5N6KI92_MONLA|nr:hypothetical protein EYC80_004907 [Monilinia laxa]